MAQNELKKELQRMMQKCPQCLTPRKIYRYTPLSENRIYELIRTGELPAFIMKPTEVPQWFPLGKNTVYQLIADGKLRSHRMTYGYVILKEDFIEYLLDSCDESHRNFGVRQKREDIT